jgi:choline dehydrogenase
MPHSPTEFDFVIVGAGTAGCLLANRLSADPRVQVLLLEAGQEDNYHWIHIPVGYLYCIGNPRTDWMYKTEPSHGLNGRSLKYPRGKVMGGCSSINGMIYMRGQARDYDQWGELTQDSHWSWQECLEFFKLHEQRSLQASPFHADPSVSCEQRLASLKLSPSYKNLLLKARAGGEWHVQPQRLRWEILDAFAVAASQAGIHPTPDFNSGNNEGSGYFEVNQHRGWRLNTRKAFLNAQVLARPNLHVWTNAQVARLLLAPADQGQVQRCTGVELIKDNFRVVVHTRREVVLCAGSIGSPQILELSGVGHPDHLNALGVRPLLPLKGVGENLQDHLQIRAVFKIQGAPTLNTLANSWWGKLKIGLEYALKRSGPMSMAPSQLGAFAKSRPELLWPNLQYHVQPLSLDAFGEPLHRFDAITASVCNLNPTSTGSVHIRSTDPFEAPKIQPNYLSTQEDLQVAADSLRLTRRIVAQPALAKYAPLEYKPGTQYQTDAELARLAGDIGTTIFHPVGTLKMGRADDPLAVVNSRLKVYSQSAEQPSKRHTVEGLRVVDASVMPRITSGNTNSPTLMIAERAAAWIAQDYS